MNVLYEDNHLIIVQKPVNVPVQKDESGSPDLQAMVKDYIKEKYGKPGNVYLGIVHRLDRPVGGVMVFARTSKAADRLTKQFASGQAHKKYYAVVRGKAEDAATLEDYLLKGPGNTSRVVQEGEGKYAKLKYRKLAEAEGLSLLEIELFTGRSHQIRVQLSSRGLPIWGDVRYGYHVNQKGQQIALLAYSLEILHPTLKTPVCCRILPPDAYPWTLFSCYNK